VTREQQRRGVLEALDRILDRSRDADDILREVVEALTPLYDAVALDFLEEGRIVPGPSHGPRPEGLAWPVRFDGAEVARLSVAPAPDEDRAFLGRVTTLIAPYCLVGWDTGGEPWEP
jgi:hypothetical protein